MKNRIRKPHPAPPGKSACELDKFKAIWRNSASEDFKQPWRDLLNSRTPHKVIRAKLLAEYGVNVNHNTYMTRLRDWIEDQDEYDAQRTKQKECHLQVVKDLGPKATLDEIRAEVLKRSYEITLTEGDFKQGLATIRENVRVDRLALDTRKVELLEKQDTRADASTNSSKNNDLTPEEQEQRIKEIYGRA